MFDGGMNGFVIGLNVRNGAVMNCTSCNVFLRVFVCWMAG